MNKTNWFRYREAWIGLLAVVLVVTICSVSSAQVSPPSLVVQDDVEPDVPVEAVVQNNFMMADENFEQWIFNNGTTAAQSRVKFETLLKLQIEDVNRICTLNDAQKKKLMLAGQGDLKRFFDLVDEKLRKFKAVKNDQQKFNEIWQEIQPLQAKIAAGFFGDGSIYQRTVKSVLNPEQVSKFQVSFQDRLRYAFNARLELAISLLDNTIGFRDDQRRKFLKILEEEIPVPNVSNQSYYYYVMYCVAQIPDSKIKPIFDEAQWKGLSAQSDQAKGLKEYLKTNGYTLPEPKAPSKPLNRMPPRRGNVPPQVAF